MLLCCMVGPVRAAEERSGVPGALPGPPHQPAEDLELGAAQGHHRAPV